MTNEVSSYYVFFFIYTLTTAVRIKAKCSPEAPCCGEAAFFCKVSTAAKVPTPAAHADFPCFCVSFSRFQSTCWGDLGL
jgi:hypothetical protein